MSQRLDARKANFKKAISEEGARRHREEHAVQIRKEKKQDREAKKRAQISASVQEPSPAPALEQLPALVAALNSNNEQAALDATSAIRKMLSIEKHPPIDPILAAGVVPRLIEFLGVHTNPKLQFEAAWAITNIASGTSAHTRYIIDAGAVPVFVTLMSSPNEDVREQATWALGNIAGDSPECRDLVLRAGALGPLLTQLTPQAKLSFIRNGTWTLSNLCRGKPQPPLAAVQPALQVLSQLIYSDDAEVLTDALWALSYLSDGDNARVQAVVEAGVCRRVVELLLHPTTAVQTPALRTIGNIVTGDDHQTQAVINAGALQQLLALLTTTKKTIKKEATWSVSNVCAGNRAQIQAVIDANIIQVLVQLMTAAEHEVRKEAVWAVSNATSGGSPDQIDFLVRCGAVAALAEMLRQAMERDSRILVVAMEGVENILKAGEAKYGAGEANPFIRFCEEADIPGVLEQLQDVEDKAVYEKAAHMLVTYFGGAEEGDDDLDDGLALDDDGAAVHGGAGAAGGGAVDAASAYEAALRQQAAAALTPQQQMHFGFGFGQQQPGAAQPAAPVPQGAQPGFGAAFAPPGGAPAAGGAAPAGFNPGGFNFAFQ